MTVDIGRYVVLLDWTAETVLKSVGRSNLKSVAAYLTVPGFDEIPAFL